MILLSLNILILFVTHTCSQDFKEVEIPEIPHIDEYDENEPFEKDILVIPNKFPKEYNYFCYPKNDLMRDRMCIGQLDAFSLLCLEDTPPIHLVPFCIAFKATCSNVNYPNDSFCEQEKKHYRKYCKRLKKTKKCKSCFYDLSCLDEPYLKHWQRYGFETARWCQKYDLFCDKDQRREKANELVPLLKDAIRVHYRCFHMFNLAQVICNPFRRQFDWQRCMKFLLDCELISDFEEDDAEMNTQETSEELFKSEHEANKGSTDGKEAFIGTNEEELTAKKIAEEEKLLEELIKESELDEKQNKSKTNSTQATSETIKQMPVVFENKHSPDTTMENRTDIPNFDKEIELLKSGFQFESNVTEAENNISKSSTIIDLPMQTQRPVLKSHAKTPAPSIAFFRSVLRQRVAKSATSFGKNEGELTSSTVPPL